MATDRQKLQKLGPNAKCGCGSGQKFKRCCQNVIDWFVDERGHVVDEQLARMSPGARASLGEAFQKRHGHPLRTIEEAREVFDTMTPEERLDYLLATNVPADAIYVYERTGIFLPAQWYRFFRSTNIIVRTADGLPSAYTPCFLALREYDTKVLGASPPEPEYMTLDEILNAARVHDAEGLDNGAQGHKMRRHTCRGCVILDAVLDVLQVHMTNEEAIAGLVGTLGEFALSQQALEELRFLSERKPR